MRAGTQASLFDSFVSTTRSPGSTRTHTTWSPGGVPVQETDTVAIPFRGRDGRGWSPPICGAGGTPSKNLATVEPVASVPRLRTVAETRIEVPSRTGGPGVRTRSSGDTERSGPARATTSYGEQASLLDSCLSAIASSASARTQIACRPGGPAFHDTDAVPVPPASTRRIVRSVPIFIAPGEGPS